MGRAPSPTARWRSPASGGLPAARGTTRCSSPPSATGPRCGCRACDRWRCRASRSEGLNSYDLSGDYHELLDDATFTVPGCRDGDRRAPPSRDNAFCSPYAAIAVDPFPGGGLPADGGYPGLEDHYARRTRASRGSPSSSARSFASSSASPSRRRAPRSRPRTSASATRASSITRCRSPWGSGGATASPSATCDRSGTSSF